MQTSKLIAVNGPPGSGKTTLALKLAQEIHEITKKHVLYISPDTTIPAMGLIFPRREKEDLHSLGAALENVNLAYTDFLSVIATTKAMPNMGYLGYTSGEGPYSYATPRENKIIDMFRILREHFEYIFVDCDRNREDMISSVACGLADYVIQVINPDIKSISYYGFESVQDRSIQVLNILSNDVYLPIQEIKERFRGIQYTIMYSRAVKMQMFEGNLMDFLRDPVFRKSVKPLVDMLLAEPEEVAFEELPEKPVSDMPEALDDNTEEFWR